MSPKAKGPVKTAEEKAAEKAAKAAEKQRADYLKAAKQGETRKVEAALEAGVDINHQNEKGQTAAHYAAAFGHRKLLQFLHAKGADFSLQTYDHHKFTPLRQPGRPTPMAQRSRFTDPTTHGRHPPSVQTRHDSPNDSSFSRRSRRSTSQPLERSRGAGRINPIPQGRRVKYGRCVLLDQG
jgi:ankyrin repeat protein